LVVGAVGLGLAFRRWRVETATAGEAAAADRALGGGALRGEGGGGGTMWRRGGDGDPRAIRARLRPPGGHSGVPPPPPKPLGAARDVDDADYRTLKDGYTARAAAVIKAIDDGRRAFARRPRPKTGRMVAWSAVVLVLAVGAGLLVAHVAGQRLPGQTLTGGVA